VRCVDYSGANARRSTPVQQEQFNIAKIVAGNYYCLHYTAATTCATLTHLVTATTSTGVTAAVAFIATAHVHVHATCISTDYLSLVVYIVITTLQRASPRRSYKQLQSATYSHDHRVQGVPFDLK
jgi:hypothetical protein